MSVKMTISGVKKLQKRFEKYPGKLNAQLTKELQRAALKVESRAKKKAPVDTGRLRSSIRPLEKSLSGASPAVVVGTPVEYAIYQERRRPFLIPAADEVQPDFEQRIRQVLNGVDL